MLNASRKSQGEPSHKLDQALIAHIRVVTSLIERRPIPLADVLLMVKGLLRQHSLDNRKNPVYQDPYPANLPP